MLVLVLNCGSSSIKYQLISMNDETVIAKGLVERLGIEGSRLKHETIGKDTYVLQKPMQTHTEAIGYIMDVLVDPEYGALKDLSEIDAIGHRVVHAGEKYSSSVLINDDVMAALEECVDLAPLHNPPNMDGIRACQQVMPGRPMVAVFDTAFHQTMRPESYLYAIPYDAYEKFGIRKYGFHGTSHKYMAIRAAEMMNVDVNDLKLITCHLGNGASVSAIKHGRSVDTSMGLTPLEGLVMGTRSGDMDPSVVAVLTDKLGISHDETIEMLNKKSGVLGISGISSDFRDLEAAMKKGDKRAELALRVFAHKVRFYIGAYIAEMNGVDAIVFTGGIGENDAYMRNLILSNLGNLGIKIDRTKNASITGDQSFLSTDDSRVAVMVITSKEELMIARETYDIVRRNRYI